MKRFQVELTANIVAFMELTVEAENEEEARRRALVDAGKASVHDWNIENIAYFGDRGQYQEIEVNDIRELSEAAK